MQNSISLALYAQNVTILEDAFDRAMGDVVVGILGRRVPAVCN